METHEYILVSKNHRKSDVYNINYEESDEYFLKMLLEHGLKRVMFSELEIIPRYNLFMVVDKIKAMKFVFSNPQYVQKPEKKFDL